MRRIVRRMQPDIVHGHYATNYGFLAALTRCLPLVQTVHGSDIMIDLNRSLEEKLLVKYALGRADLITCPAYHMTAKLREVGIAGKIVTLQYGVETSLFCPPTDESVRNPLRIVSTRHFEWKYNIELLIRAIPLVLSQTPQAEFLLAGGGPDGTRLERLAVELGVQDAIRWIGRVPYERMPELLRSSTVYVSTSITDGASLSLLEAMGCGAFPVVTDIPANREWITDGENGFLVPTDGPEWLAEKIVQALRCKELQAEVRERNVRVVSEQGSYRRNMAVVEELYNALLM